MPENAQHQYFPGRKNAAVGSGSQASAAKTSTGTGTAFATLNAESLLAKLTITAVTGTNPTLDLTLETTADGTNFYTVGTFTQQTGTGNISRVIGPLGDSCRWKWTLGGTTPNFTFKIDTSIDNDT